MGADGAVTPAFSGAGRDHGRQVQFARVVFGLEASPCHDSLLKS